MKSLKYFNLIFLVGLMLVLSSCDKYLDINDDPNQSTSSSVALQLSTSEAWIGIAMGERVFQQANVWAQYYTGGPGVSLGDWDKNTMGISDGNQVFNNLYRSMVNLRFITEKSDEPYYQAIAKILSSYSFQVCADLFGNVPYTDALKGDISDGSILHPSYDNAGTTVYPGLERDLKDALALLDSKSGTIPGSDDYIYGGDLSKWRKFANSLLVKLYVRQGESGKAGLADLIAKTDPADFILTNDDMAKVPFTNDAKGKNPFWTSAKSTALGNYFVATTTTINQLLGSEDPRINYFFDPATGTTHTGLAPGAVETSPSNATYSRPHGALNPTGGIIFNPTAPVILMSAWETNLLLAEAAARGWTTGDAAALYDEGVKASGSYLGVPDSSMTTYLANLGAYDPTKAIKTIAVQKWVCMNGLQPIEGWIETRRFDNASNPIFASPGGLFKAPLNNVLGGNNFPSIFFYPETEQSLNKSFPGQHNLTDKVFWDN